MHASITIGGIEVAMRTPPNWLEDAIARRYAPFLGAVEAPVCSLTLEPSQDEYGMGVVSLERVGQNRFSFSRPGVVGCLDLAGAGSVRVDTTGIGLDDALRLLFGLLAPSHDAILIHGTTVIVKNFAHVFTGPLGGAGISRLRPDQTILTDELVMVRKERTGWLAGSTPFRASGEQAGMPREMKLARLWSLIGGENNPEDPARDLAESSLFRHVLVPAADQEIHRRARELADAVASDVPLSDLLVAGVQVLPPALDALVL